MNPSCLIHLKLDNLIAQCAYNALLRKVRAANCAQLLPLREPEKRDRLTRVNGVIGIVVDL